MTRLLRLARQQVGALHRRLFEAFLPPTRTDVRSIGARAANTTYDNLVQADLDRLLFKDQDLASDEM